MKTDYREYLSSMSFLVKPLDEVPESMIPEFDSDVLPLATTVDVDNVTLPFDNDKMKKNLADVCRIPKMSTFAMGALINLIVSELLEDQVFLNIGVWHGFTFFCGLVNNSDKKCVGVDNFSEFTANHPKERFYEKFAEIGGENHLFYEMDCFEYLEKYHKGRIGFYMYDGQHVEESQFKGLKLAEPFFSDDCLVLVDDINMGIPVTKAIDDFLDQSRYEYEILFKQNTSQNVHPSFWNGMILLQKGREKSG